MTSPPRRLVLSLVSHTNAGKTTLARTILRRDVGEVFDQAHVTDETERFVLLENAAGEQVVLADNPGFGDSARLLRRLRGRDNPIGWLVAQVWDRFSDRALFCSQQALRHVREEADVVLYLVNASEEPDEAGYLEPELEILGWIGRPVIVLLNQTGAPAEATARDADVARWREATRRHAVVRDVLALDAFTRCWVQEGRLFERVREVVAPDLRDLLDALLAQWHARALATLEAAVDAMAELIARAAADAEPLPPGAGRGERRRAAEVLTRRLEAEVAAASDRMIELQGLHGEAAEELRTDLADVTGADDRAPPWQQGVWGGLVGGALGGLVADVATGGLSLGGGALAGAILGAASASGLARGMELLRGARPPRVAWSPAFLERLCADTLLRYLALSHFGRGAGAFRPRATPFSWRATAERALAPRWGALRAGLRLARRDEAEAQGGAGRPEATAALRPPLDEAVRAALAALHPDAAGYLEAPDPAASAPMSTGTTPGESASVTGVVPR